MAQHHKRKNPHKKHRISLRQKAIAAILMTFILLVSYAFYFIIVYEHRHNEAAIIKDARMKANLIATAASAYVLQKNEAFLQEFVKLALRDRDIEYIEFVNREGSVLAEDGLQNQHKVYMEKDGPNVQEIGKPEGLFHQSGHLFNIRVPVVHGGKNAGDILMGISTAEVNRRLARIAYWSLGIFVVTILTGLLLTYFLERRMRGSLKRLIQTAGYMARGDLTRRVNIEIGDEVEELGQSFNQMARALSLKEKELIMARNTFVAIFNGITAGIAYISTDHEIIQANHAYEDLLKDITGTSLAKGQKCFELLWQGQDVCKNCPGISAMKTGKPEAVEKRVILKNKELHVFRIHAYPVQDPGKNTVGFVEYILDISQQRKLEDELKTYTEHLEEIAEEQTRKLKEAQEQIVHQEKMAALGQMVAGVAHEINNPNSFIAYNIPLLEETWQMFEPIVLAYASAHPEQRMSGLGIEELCGDMRELIQDIKTGSDRINKIVSNLKDFARLDESGRFKPVQVNEMVEKTMAIIGAQMKKSIGKIEMDLSPNLPKIQGHFQKLEQIMANLILNAIHAIPEKDKGRLSVATRHIERLGSVLIEVEDNGIGMEQGVMDRIFEPFFTTRREAGGTGLGLSVSYGLIQEHNGIIGVLSRPGLGARFTLFLPVDREKKPDLHPSILCLDDDYDLLDLLNMHLAEICKIPVETIERSNGIMEYLENHPEVDIVLSNADSKMFGANGWELTEKIKTRFPLISIILYSTDVNAVKQRPDRTPAPDHILEKPFKIEQLLKIINTIDRQRL
jgi:signal transduction histidine kinase